LAIKQGKPRFTNSCFIQSGAIIFSFDIGSRIPAQTPIPRKVERKKGF
jgi:hypothetical protein